MGSRETRRRACRRTAATPRANPGLGAASARNDSAGRGRPPRALGQIHHLFKSMGSRETRRRRCRRTAATPRANPGRGAASARSDSAGRGRPPRALGQIHHLFKSMGSRETRMRACRRTAATPRANPGRGAASARSDSPGRGRPPRALGQIHHLFKSMESRQTTAAHANGVRRAWPPGAIARSNRRVNRAALGVARRRHRHRERSSPSQCPRPLPIHLVGTWPRRNRSVTATSRRAPRPLTRRRRWTTQAPPRADRARGPFAPPRGWGRASQQPPEKARCRTRIS